MSEALNDKHCLADLSRSQSNLIRLQPSQHHQVDLGHDPSGSAVFLACHQALTAWDYLLPSLAPQLALRGWAAWSPSTSLRPYFHTGAISKCLKDYFFESSISSTCPTLALRVFSTTSIFSLPPPVPSWLTGRIRPLRHFHFLHLFSLALRHFRPLRHFHFHHLSQPWPSGGSRPLRVFHFLHLSDPGLSGTIRPLRHFHFLDLSHPSLRKNLDDFVTLFQIKT